MIRYRNFRPTAFDTEGLLGEYHGISDFWVAPVSHTRDSGPLDESNFAAALAALGGESDTVQVHRFGHWGPGWFEIVLIDPADLERVKVAGELEAALSDYPVLDDDDFSAREWEAAEEYWSACSMRERVGYLRERGESVYAARAESLSDLRDRAPRTGDLVYDRSAANS